MGWQSLLGKRDRATCVECRESFVGLVNYRAHRVGELCGHEVAVCPSPRRCLTPDEMVENGWTRDRRGCWRAIAPGTRSRRVQRARGTPAGRETVGDAEVPAGAKARRSR